VLNGKKTMGDPGLKQSDDPPEEDQRARGAVREQQQSTQGPVADQTPRRPRPPRTISVVCAPPIGRQALWRGRGSGRLKSHRKAKGRRRSATSAATTAVCDAAGATVRRPSTLESEGLLLCMTGMDMTVRYLAFC